MIAVETLPPYAYCSRQGAATASPNEQPRRLC